MLRQKISLFIILFFTAFFATAGYSQETVTKLKEYGIGELDKVKMSCMIEGAYSPFLHIQVEIQGDGWAVCSFQYLNFPEQVSQIQLEKSFIEELVKQYAKLNFFDFDFMDITIPSRQIYDAGQTTLSYQHKDRQRSINYGAIKTKSKESLAVPINKSAEELFQLQKLYWKITNQEIYLDKLKSYQKLDMGDLANEFSSLGALVDKKEILNAKEFVPVIMEIISQEELRKSIGQYAASVLEKITDENPAGDRWNCENWIKWWQDNKAKYEKD